MTDKSSILVDTARARLAELEAERAMLSQLIRHYEGGMPLPDADKKTSKHGTHVMSVAAAVPEDVPVASQPRPPRKINPVKMPLLHHFRSFEDDGGQLSECFKFAEEVGLNLDREQIRSALHFFKRKNLLTNPEAGKFVITDLGRKECDDDPNKSAAPQKEAAPSVHGSNVSVNGHDANGLL